MFNFGPTEVGLVFLIILLIFGPTQIPKMARGVGQALKEFRKAQREITDEVNRDDPPPPDKTKPTGWYIARIDRRDMGDSTSFEQLKGQITTEILNRKQREFFSSWLAERRSEAKVSDLRSGQPQ